MTANYARQPPTHLPSQHYGAQYPSGAVPPTQRAHPPHPGFYHASQHPPPAYGPPPGYGGPPPPPHSSMQPAPTSPGGISSRGIPPPTTSAAISARAAATSNGVWIWAAYRIRSSAPPYGGLSYTGGSSLDGAAPTRLWPASRSRLWPRIPSMDRKTVIRSQMTLPRLYRLLMR